MSARKHGMARKAGLAPETLVHTGRRYGETVKVTVLEYDAENVRERVAGDYTGLTAARAEGQVTWISVEGLHNVEVVERIGQDFAIHPLVMEDILNIEQRPKLEDYGDYLYIVMRSFTVAPGGAPAGEQVSLIMGKGYVISFQESDRDLFKAVRDRINGCKGRIRREGADYLAYCLIDTLIDNYFVVLETLGETLEDLEERMVVQTGREALQQIHVLKRDMLFFRKALWPLREVIGVMARGESSLVRPTTLPYIRDIYDHTIQVIDTLETYRDILSGLLDIYLSSISNHLNQIMKVLTIISTIFIPLTFITGVFGMNFKYMPGLEETWGFPAIVLVMLAVCAVMLRFFRTRDWL